MAKQNIQITREQIGKNQKVPANCRSIYFVIKSGAAMIDKEPMVVNQPIVDNGYPGDFNTHIYNVELTSAGTIVYIKREIEI